MSTNTKTSLECYGGGTPDYFRTSNSYVGIYCNCHPGDDYGDDYQVFCDGTEEKSYCLLGCESCYTMIKEKNKREDEYLKELQKQLDESKEQLTFLKELQKQLDESKEQLRLFHQAEQDRVQSLTGKGELSQLFLSPIIAVTLKHPKVGRSDVAYNLHLDRLISVSTHFANWARTRSNSTSYISKLDHPIAFKYFVEFLYSGTYSVPSSHDNIGCLLHTLVYFLSDKLGAQKLKEISLEKLTKCLKEEDQSKVEDKVVVKMVEATYKGTEYEEEDDGEATPCASTVGGESVAFTMVTGFTAETKASEKEEVKKGVAAEVTSAAGNGAGDQLAMTMASLDLDDSVESAEVVVSDPHPMRLLVSSYAAQRLEALNKRSDFRTLLRRFPEFTVDMMIAEKLLNAQKK